MKMSSVKRTIIWAVDPFCDECSLVKRTAEGIATLASQWEARVEPVYLLGYLPSNIKLLPMLFNKIEVQAQDELEHLVEDIEIPNILKLHLIISPAKLRMQTDLLINYAINRKADLIAVGTRAKKGPQRWILGSFAETLILHSDVPLFVINPFEIIQKKFDHILFPTDFSDESKESFQKVIEFARQMNASMTLFHKINDLSPYVEVPFSAYPFYKQFYLQEVEARQQEAKEWAKQAQAANIKIESIVEDASNGSVAESILRRSKVKGGLIAMAAHSGPIITAILGSTTRQVIRTAKVPVWIVHTKYWEEAKAPLSVTELR